MLDAYSGNGTARGVAGGEEWTDLGVPTDPKVGVPTDLAVPLTSLGVPFVSLAVHSGACRSLPLVCR